VRNYQYLFCQISQKLNPQSGKINLVKKQLAKKLFSLAKTPLGDLIVGLAFGKFSSLLPVKKIKETEKAVAFWHPKPFWEKHILIVPKKPIKKIVFLTEQDMPYIEEVFRMAKDLVKELGWENGGYSLQVNGGNRQEVNQLHFHLYCGEQRK